MTVPSYVHNMDDPHLNALRAGERLDVSQTAAWKCRVFIIPKVGDAFESDAFHDQRAVIDTLEGFFNSQIRTREKLGFISGGSAIATPEGFVYGNEPGADKATEHFDSMYGLRFPQIEEVNEEWKIRHP